MNRISAKAYGEKRNRPSGRGWAKPIEPRARKVLRSSLSMSELPSGFNALNRRGLSVTRAEKTASADLSLKH